MFRNIHSRFQSEVKTLTQSEIKAFQEKSAVTQKDLAIFKRKTTVNACVTVKHKLFKQFEADLMTECLANASDVIEYRKCKKLPQKISKAKAEIEDAFEQCFKNAPRVHS
ncbi:MAG: hypothetical protein ACYCQI_10815 [Gammaproteobacteria bacterium]